MIRYCGQSSEDIARVVEGGFVRSKLDSLPRQELMVLGYDISACVHVSSLSVTISLYSCGIGIGKV
jgi:hypothetical protein